MRLNKFTDPPAPKTEVPCPACGAMLVVGSALRRLKVQCPKCREVIALPGSRMEPPMPEASTEGEPTVKTTPERAEAALLEARLVTLEARVETLEQQLASLREVRSEAPAPVPRAIPAPESKSEPEPASPSATGEPPTPPEFEQREAPATLAMEPPCAPASGAPDPAQLESDPLDATDEERMVETLGEMLAGKVAIRVEKDDADALHFGEWLGHVFMKAGWTVTTLQACLLPQEEQNLTLATSGNFPFPKMAATIHRAFAAVGLGLVFGIDPMSDSPIPTLVVPRKPAEESYRLKAEALSVRAGGN